MDTRTNAVLSITKIALPMALGLAATGCFGSGPPADGNTYWCLANAPPGTFLAQNSIKIAFSDEGCIDPTQDPTAQCKIDCQAKGWQTDCNAIQGVRNPYAVTSNGYTSFIVYESDLQAGINYCAGVNGQIVGPGQLTTRCVGTTTVCGYDTVYSCIAYSPASDLTCRQANKPVGQGLYAVSQYTATAAPMSLGTFSGGGVSATPVNRLGANSLGFNIRPDGHMNLQTFIVPTKPITINGTVYYDPSFELLDHGTVATKRSTDVYGVPPGGASFGVTIRNSAGETLFASMSNTTDLMIDISGMNPKVTGHLRGTLQGTQIDADINTQMIWQNHAPRLDVVALNTTVDTSTMPGATSNVLTCRYKECEQVQPGTPPVCYNWTETYPWFGVDNYYAPVSLDATDTWDEDPNDRVILSFNNGAYGTAKTYTYPGGVKVGASRSTLVKVQDQYTSTVEKTVSFTVQDAAKPECPAYEGVILY